MYVCMYVCMYVRWCGWPPTPKHVSPAHVPTIPTSVVLDHTVWALVGGGTKMREGWSLACWDKRGWPPRIRPSPYVILLRIRSFYVKGCRLKYREPLTLGRTWGHNPWNQGVPDPSQTRHSGHSPTWVTMPNSFAIGQRVRVYVWRSAGKTAPSRLSRLTRVSGTDTNRLGACMTYC